MRGIIFLHPQSLKRPSAFREQELSKTYVIQYSKRVAKAVPKALKGNVFLSVDDFNLISLQMDSATNLSKLYKHAQM